MSSPEGKDRKMHKVDFSPQFSFSFHLLSAYNVFKLIKVFNHLCRTFTAI